jgi:MFS family permease
MLPHELGSPMTTTAAPRITAAQVAGVTLGNALEFYDFLIFTFFAVEIGHAFFPATNPQSSLLAALATFGAGFLTRPLGGFVLGIVGDRVGRRPAMLVSFALIGIASLGVALTPSYTAIGVAAPALVIFWRLLQGFALGGEVGPSTAFLAEAAPPHRRGFYVSMQMFGQNIAVLVAGLVGWALAQMLDDVTLATWGWRIALALGVSVLPIGLVLRRTLPESLPSDAGTITPPPFQNYQRTVIIAFLALLSGTIMTYVTNFLTTFAKTTLDLSSGIAFWATIGVGVGGTIGAPLGGWLADRHGRRPAMILPMLLVCLITLPAFWLITVAPGKASLFLVGCGLRLTIGIALSAVLVHITEDFPPRVRSATLSIVYAVAISIFGGSTQFVVAWLTGVTGSPLAPAWYMAGAAAIGVMAVYFARETAPRISAGKAPIN